MSAAAPYPLLFEPLTLRRVRLRNRVVLLPHSTLYAVDGRPSDRHRDYYAERARGGVGLVITESQAVHPRGTLAGFGGALVDASDPARTQDWAPTIAAVHEHGARIFGQLQHFGVDAAFMDPLRPLLAPSDIPSLAQRERAKPADVADLDEVREQFASAAANLVAAGFDGVEVKAGHEGLLRSFLSPYFNRRQDAYGGSTERRSRFVLEVLSDVRDAIGDRPLGLRLGLYDGFPGGYDAEEGAAYARIVGASGLVDYLTADVGTIDDMGTYLVPETVPEGHAATAIAAARRVAGVPVIGFGRITRPEHAEELLADGVADLIGMTRQLVTDPAWARKAAEGRAVDIRPCLACNQECIGREMRGLDLGCVHNPAVGHERRLGEGTLRAAVEPRRVVVVGAGPAGLKAAEVAALRGHGVVVLERGERPGGQVALAATAPHHATWGAMTEHLAGRIERLGVDLRVGVAADAATVAALTPDAVIVATGAAPGPWPFAVAGGAVVLDEWQAMTDGVDGARVVVVDMGVRFEPAAVVETLAAAGHEVHWLCAAPMVGPEITPSVLPSLLRRLATLDVHRRPELVVSGVDARTVVAQRVFGGPAVSIEHVDAVVVVGNKVPSGDLAAELADVVADVRSIGDCVVPRDAATAIYEGEIAGRAV